MKRLINLTMVILCSSKPTMKKVKTSHSRTYLQYSYLTEISSMYINFYKSITIKQTITRKMGKSFHKGRYQMPIKYVKRWQLH